MNTILKKCLQLSVLSGVLTLSACGSGGGDDSAQKNTNDVSVTAKTKEAQAVKDKADALAEENAKKAKEAQVAKDKADVIAKENAQIAHDKALIKADQEAKARKVAEEAKAKEDKEDAKLAKNALPDGAYSLHGLSSNNGMKTLTASNTLQADPAGTLSAYDFNGVLFKYSFDQSKEYYALFKTNIEGYLNAHTAVTLFASDTNLYPVKSKNLKLIKTRRSSDKKFDKLEIVNAKKPFMVKSNDRYQYLHSASYALSDLFSSTHDTIEISPSALAPLFQQNTKETVSTTNGTLLVNTVGLTLTNTQGTFSAQSSRFPYGDKGEMCSLDGEFTPDSKQLLISDNVKLLCDNNNPKLAGTYKAALLAKADHFKLILHNGDKAVAIVTQSVGKVASPD